MSHALYIPGFLCGHPTEAKLRALSETFNVENVESRTIAQALENPDEIRKLGRDAIMVTHSAGMLATKDVQAKEIHAFNPPIRTKLAALSVRAAFGVVHDTVSVLAGGRENVFGHAQEVAKAAEEELRLRKMAYVAMIPAITRFDAFEAADSIDSQTLLTWTSGDDLFKPGGSQVAKARANGTRVIEGIPGGHSQFVFRPVPVLDEYTERISRPAHADGQPLLGLAS